MIWILDKWSGDELVRVLNELKARGVEDVFIFSVDGLGGLEKAIKTAFPKAEIQRCVVH